MATERRQQRVEATLQGLISALLLEEEEWPEGALVTVTRVDVSEDLEHASVLVSVFPETFSDEVFSHFNRSIGHLQHLVNKKMRMRPVPKLRFVHEKEVAGADRIEAELYKIKRDT